MLAAARRLTAHRDAGARAVGRGLSNAPRPLDGFRVLELGQLIAGPFTGTLLGYFGAEVIKVEPPGGGDPIRKWRELDVDGTSPWWRSIGRNKKSVAIDLKTEGGRDLVRELVRRSDVLIENFRPGTPPPRSCVSPIWHEVIAEIVCGPGTMEKWGLGPADLEAINPELVLTRLSGYGQTGPYASRCMAGSLVPTTPSARSQSR